MKPMLKVLGLPFDANSSFLKGPALAPDKIRLMGIEHATNHYSESGIEIIEGINYLDLGNLNFPDDDKLSAYNSIKSRVLHEIGTENKLICFGGDHSVSFPVIEAHSKKFQKLNVLHLDAHSDLYDIYDENPLSHACPFARLMEQGCINTLTQVGIRTLNQHQREQIERFGVKVIEMRNFNFDFLNDLEGPLYLSLDIDVLDPAFAPGISHHEPGGMDIRQLIKIIQNVNVEIIGADIVEFNPVRDINNVTAMVAYKLFKEIAAKLLA